MNMPGATGTWDLPAAPNLQDISTEQSYDPFTAYLQSLGLANKEYLRPSQQYQVSLYDKLNTLLGLQGRMGTVNQNYLPESGYMVDYAKPFMNQPGSQFDRAKSLIQGIFGFNPEQRAKAGVSYEPTFADGEKTSTGNVAELQDILKLGLRARYGTQGADWVSSRLPWDQQQWTNQQAQGSTTPFVEYLKQKYNFAF
jgi:hypothetical protein